MKKNIQYLTIGQSSFKKKSRIVYNFIVLIILTLIMNLTVNANDTSLDKEFVIKPEAQYIVYMKKLETNNEYADFQSEGVVEDYLNDNIDKLCSSNSWTIKTNKDNSTILFIPQTQETNTSKTIIKIIKPDDTTTRLSNNVIFSIQNYCTNYFKISNTRTIDKIARFKLNNKKINAFHNITIGDQDYFYGQKAKFSDFRNDKWEYYRQQDDAMTTVSTIKNKIQNSIQSFESLKIDKSLTLLKTQNINVLDGLKNKVSELNIQLTGTKNLPSILANIKQSLVNIDSQVDLINGYKDTILESNKNLIDNIKKPSDENDSILSIIMKQLWFFILLVVLLFLIILHIFSYRKNKGYTNIILKKIKDTSIDSTTSIKSEIIDKINELIGTSTLTSFTENLTNLNKYLDNIETNPLNIENKHPLILGKKFNSDNTIQEYNELNIKLDNIKTNLLDIQNKLPLVRDKKFNSDNIIKQFDVLNDDIKLISSKQITLIQLNNELDNVKSSIKCNIKKKFDALDNDFNEEKTKINSIVKKLETENINLIDNKNKYLISCELSKLNEDLKNSLDTTQLKINDLNTLIKDKELKNISLMDKIDELEKIKQSLTLKRKYSKDQLKISAKNIIDQLKLNNVIEKDERKKIVKNLEEIIDNKKIESTELGLNKCSTLVAYLYKITYFSHVYGFFTELEESSIAMCNAINNYLLLFKNIKIDFALYKQSSAAKNTVINADSFKGVCRRLMIENTTKNTVKSHLLKQMALLAMHYNQLNGDPEKLNMISTMTFSEYKEFCEDKQLPLTVLSFSHLQLSSPDKVLRKTETNVI